MPKAVLLDISGVLYQDGQPLPGSVGAVKALQAKGYPLRLLTNTSRLTGAEIHRQLTGMGYALQPEQIYSAPRAMRHYLEAHELRPYCLIHRNLEEEFADLLETGAFEQRAALPEEADEPDLQDLPRLAFHYHRRSAGRIRQLINRINGFSEAGNGQ